MKRLVLAADDLGLAPALTRRVVALRASGLVTDVSLLAVGESFDEAVSALAAAGVRDAGVHLCLVGGERPIAPAESVSSLLSAGRFRKNWARVAGAIAAGRIRIAEVEREWEEQVGRVIEAGLAVTHLDSHQHLHLHPALFPVAVRLARRFGVPFVRAPREDDPATARTPPLSHLRARLLGHLGRQARRLLARAALAEPPRVLGLAETGHMTAARWQSLLGSLPDDDCEIVLHPGEEDDVTRIRYQWGFEWRAEAEALESGLIHEALSRRGIVACSFADLAVR